MKLPKPIYTVNDVAHKYTITLHDGAVIGPLKSVTGVLGIIAKPQLISWAARESASYFKGEILRLGGGALDVATLEQISKDAAQAHRKKAKDAADLGTAIHAACEAVVHGQEPEIIDPAVAPPIDAFKRYRLQSDIEIVATELAVASVDHEFGGRLDFLGYNAKRGWVLGDLKSSSGFYGVEYALQVAGGYGLALRETYGIEIGGAEIVRLSKKPPFEMEVRPIVDIAGSIDGFLAALKLTRACSMPLIGAPSFEYRGEAALAPTNGAIKKATAKANGKTKTTLVGF